MAVVLRVHEQRITVGYRHEEDGRGLTKMKEPTSMLWLEPGLRVVKKADGLLWVVAETQEEE
jgi:hypothetical protein